MNIININTAIKTWLESVLGIESINLYDNGPRPDLPYSGYSIDVITGLGIDERIELENPTEIEPNKFAYQISGQREMVVNCQTFGNLSLQYMTEIMNAYPDEDKNQILRDAYIAFYDYDAANRLPINRDFVNYESASNMVLRMRFGDLRQSLYYVIEHIQVNGTIIAGDSIRNSTINVNID